MIASKLKLFSIVALCFMLGNIVNASTTATTNVLIDFNFKQDGSCLVKCGTTEKLFNNIDELSTGLNSITGEYFIISSIDFNNDAMIFNGLNNIKPYNIKFSGNNPNVFFYFDNNSSLSQMTIIN